MYLYVSRSHFPLTNHSKHNLVYSSLFYVGLITFQVFYRGVGMGECLVCLIGLVDWLRGTCSPVKDFTIGVSVVILDGASIFQMLKVVGAISTVQ